MPRVLITGATGLVGRALCAHLSQAGYTVRAALRSGGAPPPGATECTIIGDVALTDWSAALAGVDLVVHAAARTHMPASQDSEEERYVTTNALATRRLAHAAGASGVRRFVLLSSIKVNGERTDGGPFRADQSPHPEDAYGRSKLAAESALREEAARAGMSWVILRPPLVFGPGVQANFLRLMRWIDRGWPLPFAGVDNRRSLVNVWNLADLLQRTLEHAAAGNRIWLLADAEDLSTAQLIERLARALGRRARLLRAPAALLQAAATITGHQAELARLCGSLTVDWSPTQDELQWRPAGSLDEALARTVSWYRRTS